MAGGEPTGSRLQLTPRSHELREVLYERRREAGRLFEGALLAMSDRGNPVRERMAAYALRELIKELEHAAGLAPKGPGLRTRVDHLRRTWYEAPRAPDGTLGEESIGVVRVIDEFFDGYDADYEVLQRRARLTILGLDPAQREGPPAVRNAQIESLMQFHDAFNQILHGSSEVAGFGALFERSEVFLVGWLRPRPFEDLNQIDELLRSGPPHA